MKLSELKMRRINTEELSLYRRYLLNKLINLKKNKNKKLNNTAHIKWGKSILDKNKIHMEDGFIRSKGLGTHLYHPVSWIFDSKGIYYDPRTLSDLEVIINEIKLTKKMSERIENIIEILSKADVTKYNLEKKNQGLQTVKRNAIIVIGQVEGDLSLVLGATSIKKNIDLVKKARDLYPNKQICFKPHPDYEAGLRKIDSSNLELKKYCDEILYDHSISECFNIFDEFIVNTSLAGFEALIRGKKVTCFGEPFYAGWGLTKDMSKKYIQRRTRKLSIQELAYAALIEYPTYFKLNESREIEIEEAIEHIRNQKPNSKIYNYLVSIFMRLKGKAK
jgi:capsular polysaccharide export protein